MTNAKMNGSDDASNLTPAKPPPLFTNVVFHIAESQSLPVERAALVRFSPCPFISYFSQDTMLTNTMLTCAPVKFVVTSCSHRAWRHGARSDADAPFAGVTHVITAVMEFAGRTAAQDHMLTLVKPEWVDVSLATQRVANVGAYSPDPRKFFAGLIVHVADLSDGDKDAIIGGVQATGGQYSGILSRNITHIVSLSMEAMVCQAAEARGLRCKIVLPHW